MKKQIGARVSDDAYNWYAANFLNPSAGASYILESFPAVFSATMDELPGRFTRDEIEHLLTPGALKSWRAVKWPDELSAKLRQLTAAQLTVLEIWVRAGEIETGEKREDMIRSMAGGES